jgi:curved DNA-binding protein CbpA
MGEPSPDTEENVDLDPERRKYILDVHSKLAKLTPYELLGVAPSADAKTIKRTYFELARTLHPDRYFGKNLGSYRSKLEAVFARVSAAYEVLGNKTKRAEYDAAHPVQANRPGAPQNPEAAAKRQAAMDMLKQRFADGRAKAKEHVVHAERARAAGDVVGALEAYAMALRVAPGDASIVAAHAEVRREADVRLLQGHRKKAQLEEQWGRWDEAAKSWKLVLDSAPQDVEARSRFAEALAKARGTPR